jgi:nitrate reductase cytochrome c-type subunit
MNRTIALARYIVLSAVLLVVTAAPAWSAEDTSFAKEYSYSCLTGGCHETNANLVNGYTQSYMTHAMVKCNTCHGTHTAAEVGKPKPNLTGYTTGSGATGYKIPKDRCLACHSDAPSWMQNQSSCMNCHSPHEFQAGWN